MQTSGPNISCTQWRATAQDACERRHKASLVPDPPHARLPALHARPPASHARPPASHAQAPALRQRFPRSAALPRRPSHCAALQGPPCRAARCPPAADVASIAQVWRVNKTDVQSYCQEVPAGAARRLAQAGPRAAATTTTLAIRHVVSIRGLVPAQTEVAASANAIKNGTFASLVAAQLGSPAAFVPKPPPNPQPACIVDVTCRKPPPPPPKRALPPPKLAPPSKPPPPGAKPRTPPPRAAPRPPAPARPRSPPPPVAPRPSGYAALYLIGREGCQSGGEATSRWHAFCRGAAACRWPVGAVQGRCPLASRLAAGQCNGARPERGCAGAPPTPAPLLPLAGFASALCICSDEQQEWTKTHGHEWRDRCRRNIALAPAVGSASLQLWRVAAVDGGPLLPGTRVRLQNAGRAACGGYAAAAEARCGSKRVQLCGEAHAPTAHWVLQASPLPGVFWLESAANCDCLRRWLGASRRCDCDTLELHARDDPRAATLWRVLPA